jgi:hypothetical protein
MSTLPCWTFDRCNEDPDVPGRLPVVYLKASCWRSSLCSGQAETVERAAKGTVPLFLADRFMY